MNKPPENGQKLYLVTPILTEPERIVPVLSKALETLNIAALLLRLESDRGEEQQSSLKKYIKAIQSHHVAVLIADQPERALAYGADGVHLSDPALVPAILKSFKPERILGCGGLQTRHQAMTAAEIGADYIMFGDPAGKSMRPDDIAQTIAWWSEVFEIPCVAWAESEQDIAKYATAGADFIAPGPWIWQASDTASLLGNLCAAWKKH